MVIDQTWEEHHSPSTTSTFDGFVTFPPLFTPVYSGGLSDASSRLCVAVGLLRPQRARQQLRRESQGQQPGDDARGQQRGTPAATNTP